MSHPNTNELAHEHHGWERHPKPKYECIYVKCFCPKCREAIVLKVYAKQPIPLVAIAEPYVEDEK